MFDARLRITIIELGILSSGTVVLVTKKIYARPERLTEHAKNDAPRLSMRSGRTTNYINYSHAILT